MTIAMEVLIIITMKILDPISLLISGNMGYQTSKKPLWIIIGIGLFTAIAIETILYSLQESRTFGQGLPAGFIAGVVHAYAGRFLHSTIERRKASPQ